MFLQFVLIIIMSKNSYANSLNRDVLKYLPVKILPAFAGVFTIFLLTRTLSTFLYADYVFLMATVLLFGQLIFLDYCCSHLLVPTTAQGNRLLNNLCRYYFPCFSPSCEIFKDSFVFCIRIAFSAQKGLL